MCVCSWFRAGVEHFFGHCKQFASMGARWRGSVKRDDKGLVFAVVNVITSTLALRITAQPLRIHHLMVDDTGSNDDIDSSDDEDDDDEDEEKEQIIMGDPHIDVIVNKKKELVGRGPQPSDLGIDTGMHARDFKCGEHVLVWWWGKWWKATIFRIASTHDTVSLRFSWSHQVVSKYKARLIRKE